MTECTAVTQNALGIKFSALKLHEKVSQLGLVFNKFIYELIVYVSMLHFKSAKR